MQKKQTQSCRSATNKNAEGKSVCTLHEQVRTGAETQNTIGRRRTKTKQINKILLNIYKRLNAHTYKVYVDKQSLE